MTVAVKSVALRVCERRAGNGKMQRDAAGLRGKGVARAALLSPCRIMLLQPNPHQPNPHQPKRRALPSVADQRRGRTHAAQDARGGRERERAALS